MKKYVSTFNDVINDIISALLSEDASGHMVHCKDVVFELKGKILKPIELKRMTPEEIIDHYMTAVDAYTEG